MGCSSLSAIALAGAVATDFLKIRKGGGFSIGFSVGTRRQPPPAPRRTTTPPSKGGTGSYAFSVSKALAQLNSRRASEGLRPLTVDLALMKGAQMRANKGSYPHDTDDFKAAGACECLSIECKGSGDQVIEWALYKLWDFEKANTQNATAPGSPCFAVIPSDQGHYKILSGRSCQATKVGFGVAKLTKYEGVTPPAHMANLVVIWVK